MNLTASSLFARFRGSRILGNTLATLLVKGSTIGNRLVVMLLLARALPPEQYGKIAFAFSVVEIARYVADFGMDTYAVREFATLKSQEEKQSFANTLGSTKFLFGVVAYFLLASFFVVWAGSDRPEVGLILSALVPTTLLLNLPVDFFQARLKMTDIIWPVVIGNLCTIAGVSLLLLSNHLYLAMGLLPLTEIFIFGLLVAYAQKQDLSFAFRIEAKHTLPLIKACMPLAATIIIVSFYTRLDTIALGILGTSEMIGYYNIAFRFTEPFLFVATYLAISVLAQLSLLLKSNMDWVHYARRYITGLVCYGLIACAVLLLFTPSLLKIILPKYLLSLPIIYILAIVLVFRCVNVGFTSVIQAFGKFKAITFLALWNLVLIIILLIPLIQIFGAKGAAMSLLIVEITNSFLQLRMLTQLRKDQIQLKSLSQTNA